MSEHQHICKMTAVPGIWSLMKITPDKGGFRALRDSIPLRTFYCEECSQVRIYSDNIMRRNLEEMVKDSIKNTAKEPAQKS